MCCSLVEHEHVVLPDGSPFVFRQATADDADGIAHVYLEAAKAQYGHVVPHESLRALRLGQLSDRWRGILGSRRQVQVAFVATMANVIVGFAAAGPTRVSSLPFEGEVYAIYVKPSEQRRGIGRHLILIALSALRSRGARSAMLWVFAHNAARGFFETVGARWVATASPRAVTAKVAYAWPDLGFVLDSGDRGAARH